MSIFDITPAPLDGETAYFHGKEKPGQPGVYKRIYYTGDGWGKPSFCLWDGERWYGGSNECADKAMDEPRTPSYYQPFLRDGFDFAWCGLMPAVDNAMVFVHEEETPPVEDAPDLSFFDEGELAAGADAINSVVES
jgi:hypothetical protein